MRAHLSILCSLAILSGAACIPSSCSTSASVFLFHPDSGFAEARMDDRKILTYRFGDVLFKPYVKELRTPSGLNVLQDGPKDHPYHHGLMFALAAEGTDFWSENASCGSQVSRKVEPAEGRTGKGGAAAAIRHTLSWERPGGGQVLREERTIRVRGGRDNQPTLLTWESCLSVPRNLPEVTLSGAHYFGLGMRFISEMDGKATFLKADNEPGGDERLTFSRWCAVHGTVDGKPVTVAMFDHPGNPRHPTPWFTMYQPFAYLSASLNLNVRSYVLKAPGPLRLRYGVALWDGHMDPGTIGMTYQKWIGMEKEVRE